MRMDPFTAVSLVVVAVAGFGGGIAVGGSPGAKALREQRAAIEAMAESQRELVEASSRPVVIDAEVRAALASVPIQCVTSAGGDPMDVRCLWATCIQHGASSANRPECRAIEAAMLRVVEQSPPAPADR